MPFNTTPTLFNLDKIAAAVEDLQAGDPDWTYRAHNADGANGPYASIEIFDEDGISLGFWASS